MPEQLGLVYEEHRVLPRIPHLRKPGADLLEKLGDVVGRSIYTELRCQLGQQPAVSAGRMRHDDEPRCAALLVQVGAQVVGQGRLATARAADQYGEPLLLLDTAQQP